MPSIYGPVRMGDVKCGAQQNNSRGGNNGHAPERRLEKTDQPREARSEGWRQWRRIDRIRQVDEPFLQHSRRRRVFKGRRPALDEWPCSEYQNG